MRVLVACEESQTVCKAFRELGHEAYSCDIQECSGGHPEWHIHGDVLEQLYKGWDLMIAHPPCTYLSFVGNRWFNENRYGPKAIERKKLRHDAMQFFNSLYTAPIDKICIENPRGYPMQIYKYSQIIQPYYFGDECSKTTLIWLKNLPCLKYSHEDNLFEKRTVVGKGKMNYYGSELLFGTHTLSMPKEERAKLRSKTFPGIAKAMAEQWGCL